MFRELSQFLFKKNLSQLVFEWQEANRLELIAICVIIELSLQWFGYSLIWFNSAFDDWVNSNVLGTLWFVCGQTLILFILILFYVSRNKNKQKNLVWLQYLMFAIYLLYMAIAYISFGVTNIFVGVSLLCNTVVAALLMNRRIVWNAFLVQLIFVCILILLPVANINLPNVYSNSNSPQEQYASSYFWLYFLVYLSLPKALMMVSMYFHLIKGIERRLNKAEYFANYDELTQVANRRYIMRHLYNVLFLAKPDNDESFDLENNQQDVSVILLDIDHFKFINDTYGHLSGDLVLVEMAKRLDQVMIKTGWRVSRHGGEEFLVVLPQVSHRMAMEIAGHLHHNISTQQYLITDGMAVKVTASLGVASFSHDEVMNIREQYSIEHQDDDNNHNSSLMYADTHESNGNDSYVVASQEDLIIESLINMADGALYDAKRLGRNRIVSAHQYLDENNRESSIERNILQADSILDELPIEIVK